MPEAAEVAIETALLTEVSQFVAAQSPGTLSVSYPNVEFTPPAVAPNVKWLRASFLPADTASPFMRNPGPNRHFGFLQVDVFWGVGGGDIAPARLAADVIAWFKRGTSIRRDGFLIRVIRTPFRGPTIKDDPWSMVPVRVPYICYASDPA